MLHKACIQLPRELNALRSNARFVSLYQESDENRVCCHERIAMSALISLESRTRACKRWLLSLRWESKNNKTSYQPLSGSLVNLFWSQTCSTCSICLTNKHLLKTKRVVDVYSGAPFIVTSWTAYIAEIFLLLKYNGGALIWELHCLVLFTLFSFFFFLLFYIFILLIFFTVLFLCQRSPSAQNSNLQITEGGTGSSDPD